MSTNKQEMYEISGPTKSLRWLKGLTNLFFPPYIEHVCNYEKKTLHGFSATSLETISKMLLKSTRSMKMLAVACRHGLIVVKKRREGSSLILLLQTHKRSRDNWKRPRHEKDTHVLHSQLPY